MRPCEIRWLNVGRWIRMSCFGERRGCTKHREGASTENTYLGTRWCLELGILLTSLVGITSTRELTSSFPRFVFTLLPFIIIIPHVIPAVYYYSFFFLLGKCNSSLFLFFFHTIILERYVIRYSLLSFSSFPVSYSSFALSFQPIPVRLILCVDVVVSTATWLSGVWSPPSSY